VGKTEREIHTSISAAVTQGSGVTLIFIDTVHPLMNKPHFNISAFLSSFMSPNTSVVLLCHKDIPCIPPKDFSPDPLSLLRYIATAILTVHSLTHIVAQKKARDRSIAEPVFGLDEGVEGVIVGLGSNYQEGTVIEMEHRRKSGRTVKEWFFVYHTAQVTPVSIDGPKAGQRTMENVILLQEHPQYPRATELSANENGTDQVDTTFNLELTEKERKDRDAVLLPYFDAQKDGGVGEGGRILYDMGEEDDFDDEEDEI
jgi:elongator complex protein 5